jgi:hypothetical protein
LDASRISVWLLAVGAIASAVSFLGSPPDGGGLRFWNPLPRKARLLFALGASGIVFAAFGGAMALVPPSADWKVCPSVVVIGSLLALVVLIYVFNVWRLYRDRQQVLRSFAGDAAQRDTARRTATIGWCARHPLAEGVWHVASGT